MKNIEVYVKELQNNQPKDYDKKSQNTPGLW